MKQKRGHLFQPPLGTIVTGLVVLGSLITALLNTEYYPLAPYSMYSAPLYHANHFVLEIYWITTERDFIKLRDPQAYPWDEARLKTYLKQLLDDKKHDQIQKTLQELLEKNGEGRAGVRLASLSWKNFSMENFDSPKIDVILDVNK